MKDVSAAIVSGWFIRRIREIMCPEKIERKIYEYLK
jgi:hypothetical protein